MINTQRQKEDRVNTNFQGKKVRKVNASYVLVINNVRLCY